MPLVGRFFFNTTTNTTITAVALTRRAISYSCLGEVMTQREASIEKSDRKGFVLHCYARHVITRLERKDVC